MNTLPVQRASLLATTGPQTQWLIEGLWSDQAVGILGGEPKCCKSFLALDIAVSVASGRPCLRQYPVYRSGKVLLFPAEDSRPGQALRGSSELHGWGDSNLYMRRRGSQLTLSTEHRAAPSQDHIPLHLAQPGPALALAGTTDVAADPPPESVAQRVRRVLADLKEPISVQRLRQLCGLRTATVCAALARLSEQGLVCHDNRGYQLKLHFDDPLVSLSRPIDPQGNGNGKH